ncbi:MAG: Smr/MutS family protein [Chromatiales bacterium]|nr:Smr/MutS family protein [Gammaproteobacteria bacterium]MBW6476516.1 Smr/MutS family protein [Chromatiales bacterium]
MAREPRKPAKDEDSNLFRQAVADVTPLKRPAVILPDVPKPVPRKRPRSDQTGAPVDHYRDLDIDTATPLNEILQFRRAGVQHKLMRRLCRGELPCAAVLDLHGLRVAEARQALQALLRHAQAQGDKVVRVIHGKGKGSGTQQAVLKQQVNHWLQQDPTVLAFCSAQARDGGSGAVYVLLKRTRSDE